MPVKLYSAFRVVFFVTVSNFSPAAELKESTFTQVVNDVNVVTMPTKTTQPAQVNGVVRAPDLTRTGPKSRAELKAPDQTLTRIGANTVFSFEPTGRNIRVEQGSVLFYSPSGKGGGTIKSGGASAAVLGTTLLITCTANGGFKAIVLEGKGKVTLPNGKSRKLKAGEMLFVLPGSMSFGPLLTINLGKLVGGSTLVGGFSNPLPSLPLINQAIAFQNKQIASGRAEDSLYVLGGPAGQSDVKSLNPTLVADALTPPPPPQSPGQ